MPMGVIKILYSRRQCWPLRMTLVMLQIDDDADLFKPRNGLDGGVSAHWAAAAILELIARRLALRASLGVREALRPREPRCRREQVLHPA